MADNADTATNDADTPDATIVHFLRERDYQLVERLGKGACGETVVLFDDLIDEKFVCKKFVPYDEGQRDILFASFVTEVKLLHQILHPNVVRVFNHYLYPDRKSGYILMEYVSGCSIDTYLEREPQKINDIFVQVIEGFHHLESCKILHRDIRPVNILVRDDGIVKIIDLGFGKHVSGSRGFEKSITLNWWPDEKPNEFEDGRYDFCTEVYFVGKLFERIIADVPIESFDQPDLLRQMCRRSPDDRIDDFSSVQRLLSASKFSEVEFSEDHIRAYQAFSTALRFHLTKMHRRAKYVEDIDQIEISMRDAYQRNQLEQTLPDCDVVLESIVLGDYYRRMAGFSTATLLGFLRLLRSCSREQRRIVLANLQSLLEVVPRYDDPSPDDDDVPF